MDATIAWDTNEIETIHRKVAELSSIKVDNSEEGIKEELGRVKKCTDGWYLARTPSGKTLMWEFPTKADAIVALKEYKAENPDETVLIKQQAKVSSAEEKCGTTSQSPMVRTQSQPGDVKIDPGKERLIRPCPQLVAVSPQSTTKESIKNQEPAGSCPETRESLVKREPGYNFNHATHSTSSGQSHAGKEASGPYTTASDQTRSHRHRPAPSSQYRSEKKYRYPDQQRYQNESERNYRNHPEHYQPERQYYPQYSRTRQHNYWPPERPYVAPRTPEYRPYHPQYDSRYRRYWKQQEAKDQRARRAGSQAYYPQSIHGNGSLRADSRSEPWVKHGRQSSLPPTTPGGRSQLYNYENRSSRDLSDIPSSSRQKNNVPLTPTDFLETDLAPAAEECNAYDAATDDSSADQEGWVQIRRGAVAGWPRNSEAKHIANRRPNIYGPRNIDRESQHRQHVVPSNVVRASDSFYDVNKLLNQRMTGNCGLKDKRNRSSWHQDYVEQEDNLPQHYQKPPNQQQVQSGWDNASFPSNAKSHQRSFSRSYRRSRYQSERTETQWQE